MSPAKMINDDEDLSIAFILIYFQYDITMSRKYLLLSAVLTYRLADSVSSRDLTVLRMPFFVSGYSYFYE